MHRGSDTHPETIFFCLRGDIIGLFLMLHNINDMLQIILVLPMII